MTIDLQSRVIVCASVGEENSQMKVPFELPSGQLVEVSIQDSINSAFQFTMTRAFLSLNLILPELKYWCIQPSDRRYKRNIDRLKTVLLRIVEMRRQS